MGGIIPYGYRVIGKGKGSRYEIADDPLPGHTLSEADVVRLIYRLCADEGWSCIAIAGHLNRLGVPTSYAKDGRQVTEKRTGGENGSEQQRGCGCTDAFAT